MRNVNFQGVALQHNCHWNETSPLYVLPPKNWDSQKAEAKCLGVMNAEVLYQNCFAIPANGHQLCLLCSDTIKRYKKDARRTRSLGKYKKNIFILVLCTKLGCDQLKS